MVLPNQQHQPQVPYRNNQQVLGAINGAPRQSFNQQQVGAVPVPITSTLQPLPTVSSNTVVSSWPGSSHPAVNAFTTSSTDHTPLFLKAARANAAVNIAPPITYRSATESIPTRPLQSLPMPLITAPPSSLTNTGGVVTPYSQVAANIPVNVVQSSSVLVPMTTQAIQTKPVMTTTLAETAHSLPSSSMVATVPTTTTSAPSSSSESALALASSLVPGLDTEVLQSILRTVKIGSGNNKTTSSDDPEEISMDESSEVTTDAPSTFEADEMQMGDPNIVMFGERKRKPSNEKETTSQVDGFEPDPKSAKVDVPITKASIPPWLQGGGGASVNGPICSSGGGGGGGDSSGSNDKEQTDLLLAGKDRPSLRPYFRDLEFDHGPPMKSQQQSTFEDEAPYTFEDNDYEPFDPKVPFVKDYGHGQKPRSMDYNHGKQIGSQELTREQESDKQPFNDQDSGSESPDTDQGLFIKDQESPIKEKNFGLGLNIQESMEDGQKTDQSPIISNQVIYQKAPVLYQRPGQGPSITDQRPSHGPPMADQRPSHGLPTADQKPSHDSPITDQRPSHGPPIMGQRPADEPHMTDQRPTHGPPMAGQRHTREPPVIDQRSIHGPPMTNQRPSHRPPMADQIHTHGPPMTDQRPSHGPPMADQIHTHGPPMTDQRPSHGPPMADQIHTHGPPMTDQRPSHGPPMADQIHTHGPPMADQRPSHGSSMADQIHTHGPPMTDQRPSHGSSVADQIHTHGPPMADQRPSHGPPMADQIHTHGSPMTDQRPIHGPPMTDQRPNHGPSIRDQAFNTTDQRNLSRGQESFISDQRHNQGFPVRDQGPTNHDHLFYRNQEGVPTRDYRFPIRSQGPRDQWPPVRDQSYPIRGQEPPIRYARDQGLNEGLPGRDTRNQVPPVENQGPFRDQQPGQGVPVSDQGLQQEGYPGQGPTTSNQGSQESVKETAKDQEPSSGGEHKLDQDQGLSNRDQESSQEPHMRDQEFFGNDQGPYDRGHGPVRNSPEHNSEHYRFSHAPPPDHFDRPFLDKYYRGNDRLPDRPPWRPSMGPRRMSPPPFHHPPRHMRFPPPHDLHRPHQQEYSPRHPPPHHYGHPPPRLPPYRQPY